MDSEIKLNRAEELTHLLIDSINLKKGDFNLAISGGNSPLSLFSLWTGKYKESIDWDRVKIYWVDERAVPPNNQESNYGSAKKYLLDFIDIPESNVFRIKGEEDVNKEALRYSSLVKEQLPLKDGFPVFDMIILGIGEDGHTSSIFPGQENLYHHSEPYAASVNPYSGQRRVSMTGNTILAATRAVFFLTGESKIETVNMVKSNIGDIKYPASYLLKYIGDSSIFLSL